MLGHEAQENQYESLNGSRTNFLFNSVHELDAGDATTAKAGSSRSLLENVISCCPLPVNVLVRPREGNFVYSESEKYRMLLIYP